VTSERCYDAADELEAAMTDHVDRERLHLLVRYLPESEWHAAERYLFFLHEQSSDPLVLALMKAPIDDEPLTEEDLEAIREAEEEIARGESLPWETVREEFLSRAESAE
jgi:hypothetical protein